MAVPDPAVEKHLRALRRSLPRRKGPRVPRLRPRGKRLRGRLAAFAGLLAVFWFLLPPFYWPVQAPVSSGFFLRLKPDSPAWTLEVHHGIDLAAPRGTPVHPTAWGLVGATGKSAELGNYVRVDHLFGTTSVYGHLDRTDVRVGQFVVPGWHVLGLVGATGRATGPHLHFGVFWLGVALPPDVLVVFHSLRRAAFGF